MSAELTSSWINWVSLNIARGCDRDDLTRTLASSGFSSAQIVRAFEQAGSPLTSPITSSLPVGAAAPAPSGPAPRSDANEGEFPNGLVRDYPNHLAFKPLATAGQPLFAWDDFLSPLECRAIKKIILSNTRASTILGGDDGPEPFRTSRTADLSLLGDPLVQAIDGKIAYALGKPLALSEGIQGQHYKVGEYFKKHTDYFEGDHLVTESGLQGQRTWTFMIYLNNVDAGGETSFEELNVAVTPAQGRAVIWNNLKPDGSPNPLMLHESLPVKRGQKFVITKWFRERAA